MRKLVSELDLGLSNNSWIEDDSHIFGTLYYREIFKCIQFLLAHLPFQAHLDFELVCLAESVGQRIYCEMNTADQGWYTHDQLPAGATIVPLIRASDKTHLTNFLGDKHASPRYLTIGYIRRHIHWKPRKHAWIPVGLIPRPLKGAKNIDPASHSAIGTVLSQPWHLDITGPGLKWDCADGLQRQCYHLLAAWVGDYPEQVMVAQLSHGTHPMCEIASGARMGHSTF